MHTHSDKAQPATNLISHGAGEAMALRDSANAEPAQEAADNSPQVKQLKAVQDMANSSPQVNRSAVLQARADDFTGGQSGPAKLPAPLQKGVERLAGKSMNDVNVHYNSSQPAQLHAHAYAQGTDIHIGPGQEQHLAHEAWHVAQQKQGRVKPTVQAKGMGVNNDTHLEAEADTMGRRALQMQSYDTVVPKRPVETTIQKQGDETSGSGSFITEENKAAFLSALHVRVTGVADGILSKIDQSSADCPYIVKWFGLYSGKTAAYITQAIGRYAPDTAAAKTLEDYISIVTERVRKGLENHVATGTVEDVPLEIRDTKDKPEDFEHIAKEKQPIQLSRKCCGCISDDEPAPKKGSGVAMAGMAAQAPSAEFKHAAVDNAPAAIAKFPNYKVLNFTPLRHQLFESIKESDFGALISGVFRKKPIDHVVNKWERAENGEKNLTSYDMGGPAKKDKAKDGDAPAVPEPEEKLSQEDMLVRKYGKDYIRATGHSTAMAEANHMGKNIQEYLLLEPKHRMQFAIMDVKNNPDSWKPSVGFGNSYFEITPAKLMNDGYFKWGDSSVTAFGGQKRKYSEYAKWLSAPTEETHRDLYLKEVAVLAGVKAFDMSDGWVEIQLAGGIAIPGEISRLVVDQAELTAIVDGLGGVLDEAAKADEGMGAFDTPKAGRQALIRKTLEKNLGGDKLLFPG